MAVVQQGVTFHTRARVRTFRIDAGLAAGSPQTFVHVDTFLRMFRIHFITSSTSAPEPDLLLLARVLALCGRAIFHVCNISKTIHTFRTYFHTLSNTFRVLTAK